jgi:hypothetical protein
MLACNRTVLRNQSTSSQIPFAELCVARRGIGDARKLLINVVEHDPMVALPVHYCWKRHKREIAEEIFNGRAANPSSVAAREIAFRLVPSVAV